MEVAGKPRTTDKQIDKAYGPLLLEASVALYLARQKNDKRTTGISEFLNQDVEPVRQATRLSKKDLRILKPKITGRIKRRKKPHKPRARGGISTPMSKEVTFDSSIGRIRSEAKYILPDGHKYINGVGDFCRACVYVYTKGVSPQKFKTNYPEATQAMWVMLRYVQSVRDRQLARPNLKIDVDEVTRMDNPIINGRLEKWQKETNLGIKSLAHMLGGKFYDHKIAQAAADRGQNILVEDNDGPTLVPHNFRERPQKYVVDYKALVRASRSILKGRTTASDWNTLDPRSAVILSWCQKQRDLGDGDVSPHNVAMGRVPDLNTLLNAEGVAHHYPGVQFRHSPPGKYMKTQKPAYNSRKTTARIPARV
jgi:hypothetical protein